MDFEVRDSDQGDQPLQRPAEKEPDLTLFEDVAAFTTPDEAVEPEPAPSPAQLSLVPDPEPTVQETAESLGVGEGSAAVLGDMLTPDPWSRVGDDLDTDVAMGVLHQVAREMEAEGIDPSLLLSQDVGTVAAAMEAKGLYGREGLRELLTDWGAKDGFDQKQAADAEWRASMEARLEEHAGALPENPVESRLDRIERMLTEQRESEAAVAAEQRFFQERSGFQVSAMDALCAEARRRGLEPPDMEQAARVGATILHLDPTEAARLAWLAGGGDPEVFGPRPNRRTERRIVKGEIIIPTGGTARGIPRTAEEMYGDDDAGLREWAG